jgi:hypothetical protein
MRTSVIIILLAAIGLLATPAMAQDCKDLISGVIYPDPGPVPCIGQEPDQCEFTEACQEYYDTLEAWSTQVYPFMYCKLRNYWVWVRYVTDPWQIKPKK